MKFRIGALFCHLDLACNNDVCKCNHPIMLVCEKLRTSFVKYSKLFILMNQLCLYMETCEPQLLPLNPMYLSLSIGAVRGDANQGDSGCRKDNLL
jgi:hypothetical protein